MPIRGIDGLSRANVDAAVNVVRDGAALDVALNVTRAFPGATVRVEPGTAVTVSLDPATTWRHRFTGLPPGARGTLTIADASGRVVLRHTEGTYDYVPADQIETGPRKAFEYPPMDRRSDGDFVSLGRSHELNGELLDALATYREGIARYPDSVALRRAAGFLEVGLKQYDAADQDLDRALARVSNDRAAAYYQGLAAAARGDLSRARRDWEIAQPFGSLRPAARLALAGLDARAGDRAGALAMIDRVVAEKPGAIRAGGLEVALLRALGRTDEARARLAEWRQRDPTSAFLRHEATRLGGDDPALWRHLAADPERILEIAVDYMRVGLWAEAEALLARSYPTGAGVVSEPGAPRPEAYPLIAYYRGYCRARQGRDGGADYDAASREPLTYVFPNRPESFAVLRAAIAHRADDASAHFLLGSLYLSGGMVAPAMREWETTRQLNPRVPTLHRNMGYAVLRSGGPAAEAVALFEEGTKYDPANVGLYFGLDEAMRQDGRPAGARADALLAFPDRAAMPAALVYVLAGDLADAGRFDEADAQFRGRFFPREEGGVNVRQVYLQVRLARAAALAASGDCAGARAVVDRLAQPVAGLEFTRDGLEPFLVRAPLAERLARVNQTCPAR